MRPSRVWLNPAFCFLTLGALGLGTSLSSQAKTAFDLNGVALNPLTASAGRLVVLVFVRRDCPISGRYAPEIQRLSERYRQDARFYLVFPDKTESAAEIRNYLRQFAYKLSALRDADHALVNLARAHVTPEAAVFDKKGALVYHGRIDNLYEEIGRTRPRATTHDLEDALQSALHGSPLLARETSAVGCYISDLP